MWIPTSVTSISRWLTNPSPLASRDDRACSRCPFRTPVPAHAGLSRRASPREPARAALEPVLSRRDELDRARLDLEEGRQESDVLAVEVDAHPLRRRDRDPLAIHKLDFRVAIVEVFAFQEVVDAPHGFDLAGILDDDHVEHPIGRRCGRRHLHPAAEELTVRDHDLLSVRELMRGAVDDHRHRLVLVRQQSQPAAHFVRQRAQAFAAAIHLVDDLAPESGVGDVDEVAHRRGAIRGLVRDATRVEAPDQARAQDIDRQLGVDRDSQRAPKVSAGAKRHHRQLAARWKWRAIAKKAVDDLVQGAIAAYRNHDRSRLEHGSLGDLRRLEWPRRKRCLIGQAARRQPRLDGGPLAPRLAPARRWVDDEEDRCAGLPGAYGLAPPTPRGFMTPSGSMLSLIDRHTRIQPPISSATQRARTWPTPW